MIPEIQRRGLPGPGAFPSLVDPGPNDDGVHGFPVGTQWINTTTGHLFISLDQTTGAAVWCLANVVHTAAIDPSASDDTSRGYHAGSFWLNTVSRELWVCISAAVGAAVWQNTGKDVTQQQIIYVGKHGNNANDGKTPDRAKLTIGAAITAAGTPANEAAAVTVKVLDAGTYTENLVGVQWVHIFAPYAHIIGDHTVGPNQVWTIGHAESSSGDTVFDRSQAGVGGTIVNVDRMTLAPNGVAPTWGFNCQSDRMTARVNHVVINGIGVIGGATGSGHELVIDIGHAKLTAGASTCYGFLVSGGGKIIAKVGWLEGDANTTGLWVTNGEINAIIGRLTCGIAYNVVAGHTLRLTVGELTGTETAPDTANVRVTKAERNNYSATTNPTVTDDTSDGYTAGSRWLNTVTKEFWVCVNPAVGAADWQNIGKDVTQQQILYLGKHGNDANDGKTIDRAFLTIGAAVTAAGTPANEDAAITITGLDDGTYDGDFSLPSWVNLEAPSAKFTGHITIADDVRLNIGVASKYVNKAAGAGRSYVRIKKSINATSDACVACSAGEVVVDIGYASSNIQNIMAAGGTISGKIGRIEPTAAGAALFSGIGGVINVTVGSIEGVGTTEALDAGTIGAGTINAIVGKINCPTAFNVGAAGVLRLLVSSCAGVETVNAAANVRVTKAKRNNYAAATNPAITDDANDGYDVGSVWINTTADLMYVCVDATVGAAIWEAHSSSKEALEPNGFPISDDTYTTLVWSNGAKTLTITPVGANYAVYVKGKRFEFSTPQVKDISAVIAEGLWYFYYDDAGVLQASQTRWVFSQRAPVAYLYWDAAGLTAIGDIGDERHGMTMDWATHEWGHDTIGMRIDPLDFGLTGPTSGSGAADADAQVNCGGGEAHDEDLAIDVVDGAGSTRFMQELSPIGYLPVYYRSGPSAWRMKVANAFPVLEDGANRCKYNLYSAPNWTSPNVTANGRHFAVWVGVCNLYHNPVIAILGQREDVTITNARNNNTYSSLDLTGLNVEEFKVLWRLIFQTSTAYGNTPHARLVDILDFRNVASLPATGASALSHNALINRDIYPAHPLRAIEVEVEPNTAGVGVPHQLDDGDRHKIFTNEGVVAENYQLLPAADGGAGQTVEFVVQDVDGLRITAAAGDTIRIGATVSKAAGYIRSVTIGSTVRLVAINDTEWVATFASGVWEVEVS